MSMWETLQDIFNTEGFEDWEVVDDSVLISPNGHLVEWDGTSPDGEVSPCIKLGII